MFLIQSSNMTAKTQEENDYKHPFVPSIALFIVPSSFLMLQDLIFYYFFRTASNNFV